MTPIEKAKELIDKYYNLTDECNCLEYSCICFTMWDFKAKQCALILVNEIIIELQDFAFNNDIEDYGIENYWEEVKEQISTL
jgi:hypothetical protein